MSDAFRDLAPEAYAAKLRDARRSGVMRGQRRLVTILFSDVVGSTAMAEQLDPEDWADIMQEAFGHMVAPIYRYEGTVGRLMGDAIVAFFGAPIAHEDDARRAVLAGLDIVRDIAPFAETVSADFGLDFRLRVGINTGTVVVGDVGPDLAMEYTAMGDATNLASRMESTAEPGTVQITHSTYRLLAGEIEVDDLGPIDVKGKAEPVPAYRVVRMLPGAARGPGFAPPIAGRTAELERLERHLAKTRAGRGGIIFVTGEGGVGKSRLLEEARRLWDEANAADGADYLWNEERAMSYEVDRPNSIFLRILERDFGIERSDDPASGRAKLEDALAGAARGTSTEAFHAASKALLALSGVEANELEGEALKQELIEAIRTWVLATSVERGPAVIARDDVHWLDANSVDITREMYSLVEERPILFLSVMRPVRTSAMWAAKEAAERDYPHRFDEIRLEPLSADDGRALLGQLVEADDATGELTASILRKAGGNPLFIEEVVRSFTDQGLLTTTGGRLQWADGAENRDPSIPDTLHALLLGRIDALDEEAREVVQVAAVIGRSFERSLLERVCIETDELDAHLNALERVSVIEETRRVPHIEYAFRQELVRDAAYQSLLRRRRRELHLQVGEAIERTSDDLTGEAPLLAMHFAAAGDRERAFRYSVDAAAEAERVYATYEAATHLRRAIGLAGPLDVDDQTLSGLYLRLGRVLELGARFEEAATVYEELEAESERRGNRRLAVDASNALATITATLTTVHDADRARRLAAEAKRGAAAIGYAEGEAKALWNEMLAARFGGAPPEEVVALGHTSLALARAHSLDEQAAYALADLAPQLVMLGEVDEAGAAFDEAAELWTGLGNQPMLANLLISKADSLDLGGRFAEAVRVAEEAIEIGVRIGNLWTEAVGSGTLLMPAVRLGDVDRGLRAAERMMALRGRIGLARELVVAGSLHALLYAAIGAFGKADEVIDIADDESGGVPLVGFLRAFVNWLRGDREAMVGAYEQVEDRIEGVFLPRRPYIALIPLLVEHSRGRHAEALSGLDDLLGWMRSSGLRGYEPDLVVARADVLDDLGRPDEARADLRDALVPTTGTNDRYGTIIVAAALLDRIGDSAERARIRATGRPAVEYVRDQIGDATLRSDFLTQPRIAAILAG